MKINNEKSYSRWVNFLLAITLPIIIILIWEAGTRGGWINASLLPAPTKIFGYFVKDIASGKLWKNLSISFLRVLGGFALGSLIGIILGFVMGLCLPVNKLVSSITSLFRCVPAIAIIPLLILLFGIGETSKKIIIAYASFFPSLLNTCGGIQAVDHKLCEVAYTYRMGRFKTIFRIYLPSALPQILTGIRLGVSSAWMSVIASEMLASSRGIGYLITISKENALLAPMMEYVLVIGVIGLVIDKGLIRIQQMYVKKSRGIGG